MRIMGLDVGDKRIGVALSDPLGWTAQPHSVLLRNDQARDFAHLARLCAENQIEKIVVGLPLNMNGTIGPRAELVQGFAAQLSSFTGIEVEFWDERLSTKSAERTLWQQFSARKRRRLSINWLRFTYCKVIWTATAVKSLFDEKSNKL